MGHPNSINVAKAIIFQFSFVVFGGIFFIIIRVPSPFSTHLSTHTNETSFPFKSLGSHPKDDA